MKPAPFTYHRPQTRSEVDRLLGEFGDEAKILAGGQSLVPILNMRLAAPAHLVDINSLRDEPDEPRLQRDVIVVDPLVRHEALEQSSVVADYAPLLRETVAYVAHPAIRTRGTVVGSIAHADPAAELPAAFTVLGGQARARSVSGLRSIPADELFTSPLETSLATGEWIEEVRIPVCPPDCGFAVEEFARRHGDYAVCGVTALARRTGESAATVALAFVSMGPVPRRLELAPMTSEDVDGETLDDAVRDLVRDGLEPEGDLHGSVEYRMALAERLGARAARRAARMALEGQ